MSFTMLPPILHDLRHTHATLTLQAGIHPKVISKRLGHATISITLDTYSHAIPALQREAASLITRLGFAGDAAPAAAARSARAALSASPQHELRGAWTGAHIRNA